MRAPHPVCDAGADGLRCAHPAYWYDSRDGLWLCQSHAEFAREVRYDVASLPSVTLYDQDAS